eukprot:SAG11_NODE_29714_length_308_cov_0.660287_1_plen_32_part_01
MGSDIGTLFVRHTCLSLSLSARQLSREGRALL